MCRVGVSRKHACIYVDGGGGSFHLINYGKNGTAVDGKLLW